MLFDQPHGSAPSTAFNGLTMISVWRLARCCPSSLAHIESILLARILQHVSLAIFCLIDHLDCTALHGEVRFEVPKTKALQALFVFYDNEGNASNLEQA